MPKFLINASYSAEGMKGLQKEKASGREKALKAACEAQGGKFEALYYALGDHDVYAIVDLPSHVRAAALASAAAATGAFSQVRTVTLLTVAETDEALGGATPYRAPGA